MPEPARASTTDPQLRPSANGAAPLVPFESTKIHTRMRRPAALDRIRMAMTPLGRIVRRATRRA
jgi:hypothetical protein